MAQRFKETKKERIFEFFHTHSCVHLPKYWTSSPILLMYSAVFLLPMSSVLAEVVEVKQHNSPAHEHVS